MTGTIFMQILERLLSELCVRDINKTFAQILVEDLHDAVYAIDPNDTYEGVADPYLFVVCTAGDCTEFRSAVTKGFSGLTCPMYEDIALMKDTVATLEQFVDCLDDRANELMVISIRDMVSCTKKSIFYDDACRALFRRIDLSLAPFEYDLDGSRKEIKNLSRNLIDNTLQLWADLDVLWDCRHLAMPTSMAEYHGLLLKPDDVTRIYARFRSNLKLRSQLLDKAK